MRVCRAEGALNQRTPIVAFTSHGSVSQYVAAGLDDMLQKPINRVRPCACSGVSGGWERASVAMSVC